MVFSLFHSRLTLLRFSLFAAIVAFPLALRADDEKPATETKPEAAADASQPGFQSIIDKHNKAAIEEVKLYIDANPEAEDIGQAYGFLFQNAIGLNQEDDAVALAEKYLARESVDPQLKVVALQIRALGFVNQGKAEDAVKTLGEMFEDRRLRNPSAIVEFGFSLANRLQLEGNIEAVKACYEKIGDAFPLNQQLDSMIETRLDRLSLIGKPAPVLKAKDWEGKEIDLAEYKGKVLLIDFWATFCGPCIQEIPNLLQCFHKYNAKGFEVISITLDESQEQAESLVKRAKIPWRQVMNGEDDADLTKEYFVPTIPAMYIVNQEGNIAYVDLRGEDLRKALDKLLADPKPTTN